jgi:hypothetical protein
VQTEETTSFIKDFETFIYQECFAGLFLCTAATERAACGGVVVLL